MYSLFPEPQPEERAVLERAVESLLHSDEGQPAAYRSAWRRAALEEAVTADEEEEPAF